MKSIVRRGASRPAPIPLVARHASSHHSRPSYRNVNNVDSCSLPQDGCQIRTTRRALLNGTSEGSEFRTTRPRVGMHTHRQAKTGLQRVHLHTHATEAHNHWLQPLACVCFPFPPLDTNFEFRFFFVFFGCSVLVRGHGSRQARYGRMCPKDVMPGTCLQARPCCTTYYNTTMHNKTNHTHTHKTDTPTLADESSQVTSTR